jgi:hypothetical protein
MAAPQAPLPDVAKMNVAIDRMAHSKNNITQELQEYHEQEINLMTEVTRCANFPVVQVQRQLQDLENNLQQQMQQLGQQMQQGQELLRAE